MLKKSIAAAIATASLMMLSTGAHAQFPSTARGWNLGNTMEPESGEGSWAPAVTQSLINKVAASGFNTIRIPVGWDSHANQSTLVIDDAWLTRVKQVVDWCRAAGLVVVINNHGNTGWFDGNGFASYDSRINDKIKSYWTQIAQKLTSEDSKVIFCVGNEPNAKSQAATDVLMKYYQTFVTAVRGAGGSNNTNRWLVLSGTGSSNIDNTYDWMNTLPTDPTPGRLAIDVHYYDPFGFCLQETDESWGNYSYFWGAGYHTSDPNLTKRNTNWGEEAWLAGQCQKMKTKFVDKGIPVMFGEFAAEKRTEYSDLTGTELTRHLASRTYFDQQVVDTCNAYGIKPYYWDNGWGGKGGFALFDRSTNAVIDQPSLTALTGGVAQAPPGGYAPIANGTYKIINRNSGLAMDANGAGTADGTQIIQWSYGGSNNQRWTVTNTGGSNYKIIGVQSSKSLDINGASSSNGTKVQLWTYSGGTNQTFTFTATNSGYYRITPNCATGSCLDMTGSSTSNGAKVQLWGYTGSNNQQWSFQAP
jgi:aryl-phospho-beta-D-glucosidase BglC (GH1 family)